MVDKTSTGQTRDQGRRSNSGRGFGRGCGNLYSRGQGFGFNPTKLKVWGKCKPLGSDLDSIVDSRQSYKYTKITEAIINYIQGNIN